MRALAKVEMLLNAIEAADRNADGVAKDPKNTEEIHNVNRARKTT